MEIPRANFGLKSSPVQVGVHQGEGGGSLEDAYHVSSNGKQNPNNSQDVNIIYLIISQGMRAYEFISRKFIYFYFVCTFAFLVYLKRKRNLC